MANSTAAWGIDIGQCALKALRCHVNPDDPTKLIADAFDYIEYPKILTQPDAEPEELIAEAIKQFLSRNSVQGAKVAISVSTQGALARFINLPPVETKKIPDIVKYEAKQQIPFDLEEVIWDYQRMSGGSEEEGFALETEVGLFAMKRDQVYKALQPLRDAEIDVDIVQLTPLAIYNFLCFDRLTDLPSAEDYDPEEPPPSTLALSIGTQTTDLVVSNGFRIWQRTLQIGGSDFTKSLAKELNLSYAKAEHLKRNATQAEDPKAVYQAMRPVFKSLLSEVQKSMGYFSNLDRAAKIGQVLALGNSIKLPGLKRYLTQNLGQEIEELDSLHNAIGPEVLLAPSFRENLSSFAVTYGLAAQALGRGKLSTNLVPREIVRDRIIRDKKPWAVAAVALLMFGLLCNYALHWMAWSEVRTDRYAEADSLVAKVNSDADKYAEEYQAADQEFRRVKLLGEQLVTTAQRRVQWIEALNAIHAAIPRQAAGATVRDVTKRPGIHVTELRAQRFDDLGSWFTKHVEGRIKGEEVAARGPGASGGEGGFFTPGLGAGPGEFGGPGAGPQGNFGPSPGGIPGAVDPNAPAEGQEETKIDPPQGPGFVIQLTGYHYHNALKEADPRKGGPGGGGPGFGGGLGLGNEFAVGPAQKTEKEEDPDAWKTKPIADLSGGDYVRRTLLENLQKAIVEVPNKDGGGTEKIDLATFGFSHPVLYEEGEVTVISVRDPDHDPEEEAPRKVKPPIGGGFGQAPRAAAGDNEEGMIKLARFSFVVQVVWKPRHSAQPESETEGNDQVDPAGGPLAAVSTGR